MTQTADKFDALVVGAGPSGLAAADALAEAGHTVVIADAMPSVGRKFLMAGKSGLNLTKDELPQLFNAQFSGGNETFAGIVEEFGPEQVKSWARALGQELFTGSTGRVFPTAMKASPLLRAWIQRLDRLGVDRRTRWRWTGWSGDEWLFDTPDGPKQVVARVAVMALGGASWRRLGSDGTWRHIFEDHRIPTVPFKPANMGFRIGWSAHMAAHFGQPVKATRLHAGDLESRGEWIVSSSGIEGGGIYEVSRSIRNGASLSVDLLPDLGLEQVVQRLSRPRGKSSLSNHLRKALGLGSLHRALLMEWGRPLPDNMLALAERIKSLHVPIIEPMPMDEAISTAGGVAWKALDGLMLRARPGVFVAGEMLDWEAPTGGYLLTGCLASGFAAGTSAAKFLANSGKSA